MEIGDRITLLDNLLALNDSAGLPEGQVANLVEFLATQPETARDSILEYIRQEDSQKRFERFTKLANMEPGQREGILKAMGLQIGQKKGFLEDFLGPVNESGDQAKQTINDLAAMSKTVKESFLEPFSQLFNWGKQGKK